jgi:hypothetical protein
MILSCKRHIKQSIRIFLALDMHGQKTLHGHLINATGFYPTAWHGPFFMFVNSTL